MKFVSLIATLLAFGLAAPLFAQQQAAVTLDGKKITMTYTPPESKTRAVATFHSDTDLAFKGVAVPKGDYTIYVIALTGQWQLAINKANSAKAAYDSKLDLGRVAMTMGKPAAPAEECKIALTKVATLAGKIEVTWNGTLATVPFHVDRGGSDSEW